MANSILVITDVHETDNCSLKKAHDIAAPLGEAIEAIRFIKTEGTDKPNQEKIDLETKSLNMSLAEIFEDYEQKDRVNGRVVVTDDIVGWVVNYCSQKEFDLIVKAGHRSETVFHTPCDWQLIRSLQVPVLIASQQRWRNKPVVLAAINSNAKDDTHRALNNEILSWTNKWAQTFDCEVHVVYCMPVSNILKELDIIDVKEYENEHRGEGEEKLMLSLKDHELPGVKMHVTAGAPERTIPHCANKLKAELVVMGSMGRRGIHSMLKANVAEKVMHHLRTDSLIIECKK